jgi:hypothetical protein
MMQRLRQWDWGQVSARWMSSVLYVWQRSVTALPCFAALRPATCCGIIVVLLPPPQIIYLSASLVSSIYLMKWAVTQLDPNRPVLEAAKRRQKELEKQIGRPLMRLQGLEAVSCPQSLPCTQRLTSPAQSSSYRPYVHVRSRISPGLLRLQAIASEVINPDSIDVTLSDIGGLDSIIDSLVSAQTAIDVRLCCVCN